MQFASGKLVLGISALLAAAGTGLTARKTVQAAGSAAPSAEKQTATSKVVLVELFTSEGCSSCPPADALLRQVNGMQTKAGQLIVGISEHVTYWNSLGWADPYSSSIYTDRQNAYGQRFGLDSVYTPQMVVNGTDQFVGSDQAGLTRAIERQPQSRNAIALHILSVQTAGSKLSVSFSTSGDIPASGAEIFAVLADDADRSSVLRGENSGRTLTHVAVARSLMRVATVNASRDETVEIQVPASLHESSGHHLILFAQAKGYGAVLGADTRPV